jgi:hypothetical protein
MVDDVGDQTGSVAEVPVERGHLGVQALRKGPHGQFVGAFLVGHAQGHRDHPVQRDRGRPRDLRGRSFRLCGNVIRPWSDARFYRRCERVGR